jgi:PAS domain S-box-containing protein
VLPNLVDLFRRVRLWTADRGWARGRGRQATEEALRQREERFALALQGSNEGLWDWNLLTSDVYLSPRWKEIVGYQDDELDNSLTSLECRVHPGDRANCAALIEECVSGRADRFQLELRLQHREGHYVHVMLKGTAARNAAGTAVRMAGTLNDITDQRRARRLLGLQYISARTLSQATGLRDGVARWLEAIGESGEWTAGCAWIAKGDALHSIATWSGSTPAMSAWGERMTATVMPRALDTIAVTTWKSGAPRWYVSLDPADPTFEAGFASAVAMPVVFAGQTVGVVQLFSRDRQPADEDYLQILYSTNVQIEQTLQRRQIEKDLATAERKYREIVEQSVQGIYQTSEDGRFLSANAAFAQMMGYGDAAELLALGPGTAESLYADHARRGEFLRQIQANGVVTGFESQMRRRDGDLIWISENARGVVDRASGRSYCEGFVADITERKHADRLKSDFVSFATHQLRTPLSGIRWMLELAQDEAEGVVATCIEDARNSAERLIRLVNDLLDVSRVEDGQLAAAPEPIDLAALARCVIAELRPLAHEKAQTIVETSAPGSLPAVMVDPQLARQVVLNLLSNAIKYTPENGSVTVNIAVVGESVECRVTDTGIGIPESGQRKLFEKFYRADNAVAVDTEGTGLGLYLVRLIVERSGGQIGCESREGAGSTFRFTLPLATVAAAA